MNGNLLTDKSAIRDMWADHSEALRTSSENSNFDNDFFSRVTRSVHETLVSYSNDPRSILWKPLKYEEISNVCSYLKSGFQVLKLIINTFSMLTICCGNPFSFI